MQALSSLKKSRFIYSFLASIALLITLLMPAGAVIADEGPSYSSLNRNQNAERFVPDYGIVNRAGSTIRYWFREVNPNTGTVTFYGCPDGPGWGGGSGGRPCVVNNEIGQQIYENHEAAKAERGSFWGNVGEFFGDVGLDIAKFFVIILFHVAMWALGLAGTLLEFTVTWFVLGMAVFVNPTNGFITVAVQSAWTAIRDIANLAFIGGLVWASIAMILNLANKPTAMVVRILIAALLVNFSFFFAGVIIDASNFLSKGIYEAGIERVAEQVSRDPITLETGGQEQSVSIPGIGGVFMDKTRLSSVLNPTVLSESDPTVTFFLSAILGTVLFGVTAYVFFMGAFLLTARFVVLVILLITSPIGVIRWTGLPMVEGFGKQWWNALISQSLFAPIFFLFIGISFVILEPLEGILGSGSNLSSLASTNVSLTGLDGAIGLLALFTLAIGFMWASLVIARKMSESAGEFKGIYGIAGNISKGIMGGTVGAAATFGIGKALAGVSYVQDRAPAPVREVIARAGSLGTMGDRKFAAALKKVQSEQKFLNAPESYSQAQEADKARRRELKNVREDKIIKSFDDEDFQKLRMDVSTMSNEELKQAYNEALESGDEKKRKQILLADPDRRNLLLGQESDPDKAAIDKLRNDMAEMSDGELLDFYKNTIREGDENTRKQILRALDSNRARDLVNANRSQTNLQPETNNFGSLDKTLREIRENTAKTAQNTNRAATEEQKQRVIEQLRNHKEKNTLHGQYSQLSSPARATLREVVNEKIVEKPDDSQLKEIASEIRGIETSPGGMVAPQAPTPNTKPRKRLRIKKPKRDNKKK